MDTEDLQFEFVDCKPGKVYTKYLEWPSRCEISSIKRLEGLNEFSVFSIEEDKSRFKTLKVIYKPVLPGTSNYEYFEIITSEEVARSVSLKGNTLDLRVFSTTKQLIFNCKDDKPVQKTFNLVNESKVNTFFQFDNDNEGACIKVVPSHGQIRKNESVNISVFYYPKQPGFIFRKLFCLIRWQEPLLFVVKVNTKQSSASNEFNDFIYTNDIIPSYCNTYEDYIQDVAMRVHKKSKPLLSFDKKYLDLGYVDLYKGIRNSFHVFTLTNHGVMNYDIHWQTGSNYFRVEPAHSVVISKSTQIFTIIFEPTETDNMYATEIYAQACWGENAKYILPYPLSISAIGHTLKNQRPGWDALFKIQDYLVLPATVPNETTSGTFSLFNLNNFPLMFKFISPDDALFSVKPLQGMFREKFQLFVVRLLPGVEAHMCYMEEWELEINSHVMVKIKICATAELPYLEVSNGHSVKFPPTNIHSENSALVLVKNKTRLVLRFNIKSNEPNCPFFGEEIDNIIGPQQHIYMKVYFIPHSLGNVVSSLYLESSVVKPNLPHILNKSIIPLEGVCSEISLSSKESSLNLGVVLLHNWAYGSFVIYNSSACDAFVRMTCEFLVPENASFTVTPDSYTLRANSWKEINIGVCFHEDGPKQFKVVYMLYTDNHFLKRIDEEKGSKCIIEVALYSCLPMLQVIDMRLHNVGRNFSKAHFWKMLQINRLNRFLQKFSTFETSEHIYMKMPTCEEDSEPLSAELLIKNPSPHGAVLNIVYEKICSCEFKMEDKGISIRALNKHCPHDSQVTFVQNKTTFLHNETGTIELHSCYTNCDRHLFKFLLTLSSTHDPSIKGSMEIYVERHSFRRNTGLLDFYCTTINNCLTVELEPVYVGDPCKPIQILWMYNNSGEEISYKIKPKRINCYREQIFNFLNVRGIVGSLAMHPIMIKFKPYQFIKYSEEIEVFTPQRTFTITIESEGKARPYYNTFPMLNKVYPYSLFTEWNTVEISVDTIVVRPTLLHSTVKRLVFLKNHSSDKMQFFWVKRRFGALLDVRALPVTGVLEPNEILVCQIVIHTLCAPARFNATITCKFTNIRQKTEYFIQVEKYKKAGRQFDSYFGFENVDEFKLPKPNVKRSKKPFVDFKNITICIHTLSENQLDMVLPRLDSQVKSLVQNEVSSSSQLNLNIEGENIILGVLSKVVWEVLHKTIFLENISQNPKNIYYRDIIQADEKKPKKYPSNQLFVNILNGMACNILAEKFDLNTLWGKEIFFKQFHESKGIKIDKNKKPSNLYYSDIIDQGPFQVTSLYSDKNILLERRISDVSKKDTKISFYEVHL